MADNTDFQDLDMELEDREEVDDELSSYGVFVKAGPEDVQEESSDVDLADLEEDFSIDLDEPLDETLDLSDEEETRRSDLEDQDNMGESDDFDLNSIDSDFDVSDGEDNSAPSTDDDTIGIPEFQALDDEDDLGDLGDLSDLEASIEEELAGEDEDEQTIYLEEDELQLQLDDDDDISLEEDDSDDEIEIDLSDLDGDMDDITIPDLDDEISVLNEDDFSIEEMEEDGPADVSEDQAFSSEPDASPSEALPGSFESLSELDDDDESDAIEDIDIDAFMDRTAPETVQSDEAEPSEADDFLELDEDNDVLSNEKPQDDSDFDLDIDSLLDMASDDESTETQSEEKPLALDDLPDQDFSLPGADEDVVGLDDMPDTDYNEDLEDLDAMSSSEHAVETETEIPATMETEASDDNPSISELEDEEGFDDVAAFSESLREDSATSMVDQALAVHSEPSEEILHGIESELSSIKSELTDLREELRRLRSGQAAAAVEQAPESSAPIESPVVEQAEEPEIGGFFASDDEDETIALTGDELDNILNTAEFTEEAGESNIDPEDEDLDSSDSEFESPSFEDSSDNQNTISEVDSSSDDPFRGNEAEIQAMADLDIEEELAGIDDLGDEDTDISLYTGDELDEMELELPDLENSPVDGDVEPDQELEIEDEFVDEIPLDEIDEDIHLTEELSPEEERILANSSADTEMPELDLSGEDDIEEISLDEAADESPQSDEIEAVSEAPGAQNSPGLSSDIRNEIKAVLTYMDSLLENLPDEKIVEFAQSEHYATYQKLFEELGL